MSTGATHCTSPSYSASSSLILRITGMLCEEFCGTRVVETLAKAPGVAKVEFLDFKHGIVQVQLADGHEDDDGRTRQRLMDMIENLGYEVHVDDGKAALGDSTSQAIVIIEVEGMTCQSCTRTVERALSSVPNVSKVRVDLPTHRAYVMLAPPYPSPSALLNTIEAVGYGATLAPSKDNSTAAIAVLHREVGLEILGHRRSPSDPVQLPSSLTQPPWAAPSSPILTSQAMNRIRFALRKCPGVVCALVVAEQPPEDDEAWKVAKEEKESNGEKTKVVGWARVRIQEGVDPLALVGAVEGLGWSARPVEPMEARKKIEEASMASAKEDKEVPAGEAVKRRRPLKSLGIQPSKEGHLGDTTTVLEVKGMTCGACVSALEGALGRHKGVVKAKVALLSEKAEVLFDSHMTNVEALLNTVEAVGYEAKVIKTVREDGLKSDVATFQVKLPMTGPSISPRRLTEGLSQTRGVLEAVVLEKDGNVQVRYESELVGLRDLVKALEGMGYRVKLISRGDGAEQSIAKKQEQHMEELRELLVFAVVLTVPITILSMAPMPGLPLPSRLVSPPILPGLNLKDLILFLLSTPVQIRGGWRFYEDAYKGLKGGSYGMSLLVAMGTTAAYLFAVFSLGRSIALKGKVPSYSDFFMTSAMLLSFILLGKFLEHLSKKRTSSALSKLMDFQPKKAVLLTRKEEEGEDEEEVISADMIQVGDRLKVVRGSKVPADGVVVSGEGFVNEALITGESMPVHKTEGDRVIGGSINTEGLMVMRVTGVGEDSVLKQIIKLMEEAQMSKAPIQELADKIAGSFALVVLSLSVLTFIGWLVPSLLGKIPPSWIPSEYQGSPILLAFTLAVSTMVIACPCSMGLATPTAIMVGTGVGATSGVLIKGGQALETAYKLSAIVFDKTGTLTLGQPMVADLVPFDEVDSSSLSSTTTNTLSRPELAWLAGCAELGSEHPLGKCIVRYAAALYPSQRLVDPLEFKAVSGKGLTCRVGKYRVAIGNLSWMKEVGAPALSEAHAKLAKMEESLGKVVVFLAVDELVRAIILITDEPRPEAATVIRALFRMGLKVYMVTGDNRRTAATLAQRLGLPLSNIMAETLPSNKVAKIKELQQAGMVTAMVGDGINDAPALAQADVGIAIGAGTDIATEAADMVLIKSDLRGVLTAIDLSHVIVRRIYLNLTWAMLYNIVSIPIAAGLFMPLTHTAIPPYVAGLAMALSSVSVLTSSLLLKWYRPPVLDQEQQEPPMGSFMVDMTNLINSSSKAGENVPLLQAKQPPSSYQSIN